MNLIKKFKISHTAKNVNSKKLLGEINTTISDVINEYIFIQRGLIDSTYDYTQLAEFVKWYMHDMEERNIITQHDVVCDDRNNDPFVVRKGTIYIKIEFIQYNCLNRTSIEYKIWNA